MEGKYKKFFKPKKNYFKCDFFSLKVFIGEKCEK